MLRLEHLLPAATAPCGRCMSLTLEVAPGQITALLGANGAGKSSTIMCVAGHVEMHGGTHSV
jgi:ABC-type multidrug transport system ATPase subunit